jgi:ribosome-associated protein
MGDDLVVTRSVRVPRGELQVSFSASGGPGGQHANRNATRVDLRFDVVSSSAFTTSQRERVIAKLGPEVRVSVDDERSQLRNREIAERRLADRLRDALRVERRRRPTKPTAGSKRRRVQAKQRRSQTKRQRRRPTRDDW